MRNGMTKAETDRSRLYAAAEIVRLRRELAGARRHPWRAAWRETVRRWRRSSMPTAEKELK